MRAVHAGDRAAALALIDASHAALHQERLALRAAGEAIATAAGPPPGSPGLPRRSMYIGEVAACLGVHTSALRTWESAGLLAPGRERGTNYRRFSPADVRDAQVVSMLRQGHYPLPEIRPIIAGLRRAGSTDALRAAIARRNATLTRQGAALLEGASHLCRFLTPGPDPAQAPRASG